MTSTWPLSAAATALLCDMREGGPAPTTAGTLSRLTVKELVLRGQLRVVSVKKRRMRRNIVTVATAPPGSTGPLPPPLDFLAARIPPTSGEDLSVLIKAATQRQPQRFAEELKQSALADLRARGLVEDRRKKVMGLFPTTYQAPTALGLQWQTVGLQHLAAAQSLPSLATQDRNRAADAARTLGVLVLLAPAALATTAMLGAWLNLGSSTRRVHGDAELDGDFDVLAACVDALSGVAGDLGDALGALDGAFDAVADAVDSAIDAGVSDGGGDGGSSDGGGDGGGGGGD